MRPCHLTMRVGGAGAVASHVWGCICASVPSTSWCRHSADGRKSRRHTTTLPGTLLHRLPGTLAGTLLSTNLATGYAPLRLLVSSRFVCRKPKRQGGGTLSPPREERVRRAPADPNGDVHNPHRRCGAVLAAQPNAQPSRRFNTHAQRAQAGVAAAAARGVAPGAAAWRSHGGRQSATRDGTRTARHAHVVRCDVAAGLHLYKNGLG